LDALSILLGYRLCEDPRPADRPKLPRDIPVLNPRFIDCADGLGAEKDGLLSRRTGRLRKGVLTCGIEPMDRDRNDCRPIADGIVVGREEL